MTLIIVIITSVVSILAFSRRDLFAKLLFNPYQVYHRKEWYRLITHGLLHADWLHLIINMMVLFSFGRYVESYFRLMADLTWMKMPMFWYVLFYLLALVISSLVTLRKHKDDIWYNSVGASGAVSAVLFCSIFFDPNSTLLFMGFIPIKAYIFGPLYLIYSYYSSRKAADNVNHDAHLLGAVFGFCFPLLVDIDLIRVFIGQFQ
ncbi:MAG: rhomboid family intramembrane serine protease [Bacteroidales bacterium]|jgi:membrane associated rhomboid family serine protease|nr:rhomboid family intramembrane serine protease [Bacteroidales bacterium]